MVHPDAFRALVGRRAGALSADNARLWTDPCFAICPCQYGNLTGKPFPTFSKSRTLHLTLLWGSEA
jgi:hypothetical protein